MTEASSMPVSTPVNPPRPRRRMLLMIVLGAVILACGMAIGSGATILWIRHQMHRMRGEPDRMPVELASRIQAKLALSPDQATGVEQILRKNLEAVQRIHQETFPRVQAEVDKMRAEVSALLTPQQAEKWNSDFDEIIMFPKGPPPGPRGPPPPPGGFRGHP
jgi:hypothetical protein